MYWSERGGSNSRPQPWQGYALPLSYSRMFTNLVSITFKLECDYSQDFFVCKGFWV